MPHIVGHPGKVDLENTQTRGTTSYEKRRKTASRFGGLVTTPVRGTSDIKSFFDQCASSGFAEPHGNPKRLFEYRLGLVRNHAQPQSTDVVLDLGCGNGHHLLALGPEIAHGIGVDFSPGMIRIARDRLRRSSSRAHLTFEVDDADELKGTADQSVDLVICIGAFEHMLNKPAVLASVYRVLKVGGRFFCLAADADYMWYRTIAPLFGFATKHLASDKFLTSGEFVGLLHQAGFRRIRSVPWTFIPKGDMPALAGFLLTVLDEIGRRARINSLRGGLSVYTWKDEANWNLQANSKEVPS